MVYIEPVANCQLELLKISFAKSWLMIWSDLIVYIKNFIKIRKSSKQSVLKNIISLIKWTIVPSRLKVYLANNELVKNSFFFKNFVLIIFFFGIFVQTSRLINNRRLFKFWKMNLAFIEKFLNTHTECERVLIDWALESHRI